MPLANTFQTIDPFSGEQVHFKEYKQIVRYCYEVIKRVVAENEKRGKKGDERFHVCAILRDKPERHTFLNLTCDEPAFGIQCSKPNRAYAGALSHAENLISGEWMIATVEQEAACIQRDKDDAIAKAKHSTDKAALQAGETFSIASRLIQNA